MSQSFTVIEYDELAKEEGSLETSIVGLDDFKEFIASLKQVNENLASAISQGVVRPRGIIFNGPPGTGKTLVAKYVAKELGYNFLPVSAASLQSPLPSVTIRKIQCLFDMAESSGNCVMFIDEIDALIKDRAKGGSDAGGALQKFLEMLDGTSNKNRPVHVLVIVATNHIENLDKAFIRPGRFDRKIYFGLPGKKEREEFITKAIKSDIDIDTFVDLTDGLSFAELNALINEALFASFITQKAIDKHIMIKATQEILSGSSSQSSSTSAEFKSHMVPHMTGHTLAYMLDPSLFTMGNPSETALLSCSPKTCTGRIATRKELIIEALSIIWAFMLEIQETGHSSSLCLEDQKKLSKTIDNLLDLFGVELSVTLNRNKLQAQLGNLLITFVIKVSKITSVDKAKNMIMAQYKNDIITRSELKNIMTDCGLSSNMLNTWYDKLIELIEKSIGAPVVTPQKDKKLAPAKRQRG